MPIMIQLTDDDGIKVYINANHIVSMMPYTLRKKEYTRVDTSHDTFYVKESPEEVARIVNEVAAKMNPIAVPYASH